MLVVDVIVSIGTVAVVRTAASRIRRRHRSVCINVHDEGEAGGFDRAVTAVTNGAVAYERTRVCRICMFSSFAALRLLYER